MRVVFTLAVITARRKVRFTFESSSKNWRGTESKSKISSHALLSNTCKKFQTNTFNVSKDNFAIKPNEEDLVARMFAYIKKDEKAEKILKYNVVREYLQRC